MNEGQNRFHDFLMSMVAPGNETAAEAILAQSFERQDAGRLPPDAVDQAVAQLTPLLKPGGAAELQKVAARMKEMSQHGPGGHGPDGHGPDGHGPDGHGHGGHGPGDHGPGEHHWDGQRLDSGPQEMRGGLGMDRNGTS